MNVYDPRAIASTAASPGKTAPRSPSRTIIMMPGS